MAGIQRRAGESLMGRGPVSYRDLETYPDIELKLSEIRGFTFG